MINFFRTRKFRQRCQLLAVKWIKELAGATEEQALEFVNGSHYFDDNLWIDFSKPEEYNTDRAIIRTLNFQTSFEVECVSEGRQMYTGLRPGVIGIGSEENFHRLRITYALGAVYVAHLTAEIEDPVPDGFLSSTILNTEINLLEFMINFYEWKDLPVATADGQELPFESYLKKLIIEVSNSRPK